MEEGTPHHRSDDVCIVYLPFDQFCTNATTHTQTCITPPRQDFAQSETKVLRRIPAFSIGPLMRSYGERRL